MSKVLLIGAGASYGARLKNFEAPPPLGNQLLQYLISKLSLCQQNAERTLYQYQRIFRKEDLKKISDCLLDAQANNLTYEQMIDRTVADSSNLKLLDLINRFLSFCFSYGGKNGGLHSPEFELKEDLYFTLINKLNLDSSWKIISLNYDTFFEYNLQLSGKSFHYSGMTLGSYRMEPGLPDSIEIFKPHGSINWFGVKDQVSHSLEQARSRPNSILTWNEEAQRASHQSVGYYACMFQDVLSYLAHDTMAIPIMAHFGKDKYSFWDMDKLQNVRRICIDVMKNADSAIVLGVHFPTKDDDRIVHDLFSRCNKVKDSVYINPSARECDNVATSLPNIQTIQLDMEGWLSKL